MKILSPEDYQKKYGTEAYVNLHKISSQSQQPQEPNVFQRIGNTIKQAGSDVADRYQEGVSGQKSPLRAGAEMAASAFNAVPQVAIDTLPGPARKGLNAVGKFAGETVNNVANNLGKNPFSFGKAPNTGLVDSPQFQNFANSKAGKATEDVAGTLSATGQIAGDILTVDQGVKAAQKGVDLTKQVVQKTGQMIGQAKGEVQDIMTQAKDYSSKLRTNNNPDTFVKDLVTPEMKGQAALKAVKSGKVVEAQGMGQRDFSGAVSNLDDLQNAVKEVPGVSASKTKLQNLNAIHDEIGNIANTLEQQVAQEKSFFSPNKFKSIMEQAKARLVEDPTLVGDAATSASKVITKFEQLVEQQGYTSSGLLQARKLLDNWIREFKPKAFNPATESGITGAIREIRQTGNQFLADISPNSAVKDLLAKQSTLYRAIDNIAPKAVAEGSSVIEQIIKSHPAVYNIGKTAIKAAGLGAGVKMGIDILP